MFLRLLRAAFRLGLQKDPRLRLMAEFLDKLAGEVDKGIREALKGAYTSISSDGWKDKFRNQVTGIHAAAKGKVREPFTFAELARLTVL